MRSPKRRSLPSTNTTSKVAALKAKAHGEFSVKVINPDGTVDESKSYAANQNIRNLIFDSGLDRVAGGELWREQLDYGVIGTGTEPTVTVPDGTYSRSGTTVVRDTGTGEFAAGDVGKIIRWDSGEESYITTFTDVDEVEVEDTDAIVADGITLYAVNREGLDTEAGRSATYPEYEDDDGLRASDSDVDLAGGEILLKRTYDHDPAGVGGQTVTEIAVSSQAGSGDNVFAAVVLPVAVFVAEGQQLRMSYKLFIATAGALLASQEVEEGGFAGWPISYDIDSVASTPTEFTVTLSENHHFQPGNVITIAGVTPSDYNGEWTVASVTSATVTITEASDFGAGTGGTLVGTDARTFIAVNSGIAALTGYGAPVSPKHRAFGDVDDATLPADPDNRGILDGGEPASEIRVKFWDASFTPPAKDFSAWIGTVSYPANGSTQEIARSNVTPTAIGGNNPSRALAASAYVAGTFYRDHTTSFPVGALSESNWHAITFYREQADGTAPAETSTSGYYLFDQPQRKDNTHTLALTFRVIFSRDLSYGAN